MTQIKQDLPKLFKARSNADAKGKRLCRRWAKLCQDYLPVTNGDSIWRFNRKSRKDEPLQGWKLHISATVLEACAVFAKIAPWLNSQDIQFKAPKSLDELCNINSGLRYGYQMLGKFITVYPLSENQALQIAQRLDEMTRDFFPVPIPFDEQFSPQSSVFYRYGAFGLIEIEGENGEKISAVKNSDGKLVPDNRRQAVPEWIADPFKFVGESDEKNAEPITPLTDTYKVFRAITQRGKGGTYHAVDLSQNTPRFCIVKEGRRFGEVSWNGQDGLRLLKNEFFVLKHLEKEVSAVPRVFSSFEIDGDFYLVMEFIDGKSLQKILLPRQRRFSIKKVLDFAVQIARLIESIHSAGWIWNDCKPSNIVVTRKGLLRPIDFEGAYPRNAVNPFDWRTKAFSRSPQKSADSGGVSDDLYSFGAVLYFLLTGRFFDAENPLPLAKLRRKVPPELAQITGKLLFDTDSNLAEIIENLKHISSVTGKT